MSLEKLALDEAVGFEELFAAVADHHDPNTATRHDLLALAGQSAGRGGLGALLAGLFENPVVVAWGLEQLRQVIARKRKPTPAPELPGTSPNERPTPSVVLPPAPPAQPATVVPDGITLALASVSGPRRVGAPARSFALNRAGVIDRIAMTDGTDSLDDGSLLALDAEVTAQGQGLRIDLDPARTPPGQVNHPELLGKIRFRAEDAATGETLAAIGGAGLEQPNAVENGAAFVPRRWKETGGMSVSLVIKRQGGPVRVWAEIASAESGTFETPSVR